MKLREYEAKAILRQHEISIPYGIVIEDINEVEAAFEKIGKPVVIKPQISIKDRGKAGLIRFADTLKEAEKHIFELLKLSIQGEKIQEILIEKKIEAVMEIYVSVTIDRAIGKPVIIISSKGGSEVEFIAKEYPNEISFLEVDSSIGIREYKIRAETKKICLRRQKLIEVTTIATKLYELFEKFDAETIEINPLIIDHDEKAVAAHAVLNIDDDSLYRHPELKNLGFSATDILEKKAYETGFSFVNLDGDIGIIGNGAGLTLSTLDMVQLTGGKPAYFFDIGGGISSDGMRKALELALQNKNAKIILVNVFAGISRCDEIARGISLLYKEKKIDRPIVVRFSGTYEKKGIKILTSLGIPVFTSMDEAVEKTITLSRI